MASGPCLRRCRVVRRYMPTNIKSHRLYVKLCSAIHVSMYYEPCREVSAVNTGVPCPKVPIHRKLGSEKALDGGGKGGALAYPHSSPYPDNDWILWRLVRVGGDEYLILNKPTGNALDAGGDGGSTIYLHPSPNTNGWQQWTLSK